jgi:hypothetical protein
MRRAVIGSRREARHSGAGNEPEHQSMKQSRLTMEVARSLSAGIGEWKAILKSRADASGGVGAQSGSDDAYEFDDAENARHFGKST